MGGYMKTLSELIKHAQQLDKQVVSIANAADVEVLRFVKQAVDQDLASFLLHGDQQVIQAYADKLGFDLNHQDIEVVHTTSAIADAAVQTIDRGDAHILMKGNISTKALLQAVLNKQYGLRTGGVLSHSALFEIPSQNRLLFLTDAAMNISPSLKEKVDIIHNTVQVAHAIGILQPKVAVLAPVEVINPAMQSTLDAAALTQMQHRGQINGCMIDGPLAFDNAVSLDAARQKDIVSDVAGRADILLAPSIEVANALYKSFIYFAQAKVAAIISGAKAPIVLTSRADTAESKLYSLALALLSTNNRRNQ